MSSRSLRRGAWSVCALACAIAVAACGSSSSSSTVTGSASNAANTSSPSNSAPAQAQTALTQGEQAPTSIEITTPLSKKPPTGKTIAFLRCSQPVCNGFQQGLQPAAKALGWTIKYIPFQPTPQSTLSALSAAIQSHPDGIFTTGLDRALIASDFSAATAAHIPIITGYSVDSPAPPVIANIADGTHGNSAEPTLSAENVAVDSGCKGSVALFNIPLYPILAYTTGVFKAQLAKLCPNMSVKEVDVQATDVGTKLPQTVVSTLQADPSAKYVALAFGDMALGVPQALKGAGLSAKVFGYGAGSPPNIQDVASGNEFAETATGIPYNAWRAMDAFARYFVGDSTAIDTTAPNPAEIFTKSNAAAAVALGWNMATPPNYQKQFEALWHVG
ncbi:MAG: substrate-binding domain-containing protein [Solirubrobacterales bacterium]|nr:substrate-binding domain-containing protein [Solirubrobacterales bacterium]